MKTKPKLFDVVIYKIDDGVVDTIAGKDMERTQGHYNAEKRMDTVITRLNDKYNVSIVPAGIYNKGDVLKRKHR